MKLRVGEVAEAKAAPSPEQETNRCITTLQRIMKTAALAQLPTWEQILDEGPAKILALVQLTYGLLSE
jgi:hypothetical protein